MSNSAQIKPRRFEMGVSAIGLDLYMANLGWRVSGNGHNIYRVSHPTMQKRPVNMHFTRLVDFLDEMRVADGLEPIRRKNRKPGGKKRCNK